MTDLPSAWSDAASRYEQDFVDPFRRTDGNILMDALREIADPARKVVGDLGCGIGPLLPFLAGRFATVHAVDFAPGMIERARERCGSHANISFRVADLTDLSALQGTLDVAVMVNSLAMPSVGVIEGVLKQVRRALKPGGVFMGILPAIDSVHYETMLLVDRARKTGMPEDKARLNAAEYAEHHLYDLAFGGFSWTGLEQHFWQPFEIPYRLRRAGFVGVRKKKFYLDRAQFACAGDLRKYPPPWDWFFTCIRR